MVQGGAGNSGEAHGREDHGVIVGLDCIQCGQKVLGRCIVLLDDHGITEWSENPMAYIIMAPDGEAKALVALHTTCWEDLFRELTRSGQGFAFTILSNEASEIREDFGIPDDA